jgi:hypothetical protein
LIAIQHLANTSIRIMFADPAAFTVRIEALSTVLANKAMAAWAVA